MSCALETEHQAPGFTLIELLVAMAISAIVLSVIVGVFVVQRNSYVAQEQIAEMVQTARAAMDMIGREVRMAGYDPEGAGFSGIAYDASKLQIRADLRGDGTNDGPDGDTSDPNENITYKYYDTTHQIKRRTGGGYYQPFAENIQAFTFSYLNGDGHITTTTSDIRQINITITARTSKPDPKYPANNGYRTYSLASLITPSNLAF
ncbi:MAG: prepilin-type N-terminal cleavage/methylation domain-containing protein [Thermodesulfobacteriota bacterium]|nr:prepilin-type N-terminal cleavage/methylation domain-containing protein [Thermodesulfobacteriota bacterium]